MTHPPLPTPVGLESRWTADRKPLLVLLVTAVVGAALASAHALCAAHGWRRFMLAYLVAFAFVLSLSAGGMVFVLLQHLTRARWSVLIRRFAEALAANMLLVVVLFIPLAVSILLGHGEIYPWAGGAHAAEIAAVKGPYLSPWPFLARWAVFLALWAAIGLYFWRNSIRQDTSRDYRITRRMEKLAAPAAIVLGLTMTLGAFDLLMSLDPHWYSTIFGIYFLAGGIVGGLASMILLILGFQRGGMLTRAIGHPHYLDLGRLLFAFLFFWAYIAFSQYMLLWYASIPATTSWLRLRGATTVSQDVNAWSGVALVLLFGHFLVPFAALMSRHIKGHPGLLALGAGWMLLMHWLDLVWVVMPAMGPELRIGGVEIGLLVALASVFTIGLLQTLARYSLVPLGDPRLGESVVHETVY